MESDQIAALKRRIGARLQRREITDETADGKFDDLLIVVGVTDRVWGCKKCVKAGSQLSAGNRIVPAIEINSGIEGSRERTTWESLANHLLEMEAAGIGKIAKEEVHRRGENGR